MADFHRVLEGLHQPLEVAEFFPHKIDSLLHNRSTIPTLREPGVELQFPKVNFVPGREREHAPSVNREYWLK